MDFSEKLQILRNQKGLTQQALADALFVSRTAVSKWESGRGYPNLDSLKAIAKFFAVSVDTLLSDESPLPKQASCAKKTAAPYWLFALLDCAALLFLVLPVFGQTVSGDVQAVGLLWLTGTAGYLQAAYWILTVGSLLLGGGQLLLRNPYRLRILCSLSLCWSGAALLLCILSRQPYAAVFWLLVLGAKGVLLRK